MFVQFMITRFQIDGIYYFRLVDERACLESDVMASAAPDCLRSAIQMTNITITSLSATFQVPFSFPLIALGLISLCF